MSPSRRRILLFGGLTAVLLGIAGMAVAPDRTGLWLDHPHGPMMGWWDPDDYNEPASPRISGARQISVQAGEFLFDPSRIQVRADQPVNIRLLNRGGLFHDFTIEGLDFHLSAPPGDRSTGGLEAPAPGSYRFVCAVPGHADAGMVGTLVVR